MPSDPSIYELRKAYRAQQRKKRGGRPTCKRCGREIVFVKSAKSGKKIPCDPHLDYGDSEKTLVTLRGEMIPEAGPKVLGREPHFGTCPVLVAERERKKHEKEVDCTIYHLHDNQRA